MNVQKCLALHNEILRLSWLGSGRPLSSLESNCKTWFDMYGAEAETFRSKLAPDLVEFLKHARIIYDAETGRDLFFFYWVQNLASPEFMLELEECFEDEPGRCLVLYAMSNFNGHFCGLIYDQETHLCIISGTAHEVENILKQEVWYPLETVLEFWLDQIRKGKIAALPEIKDRAFHKFEPWSFVPYNSVMLEENIEAFNRLVEAIEARMPVTAKTTQAEDTVQGLVDASVLQTIDIPNRFAHDFIQHARRPRFQNIAPGLAVLSNSSFPDQPFRSYFTSSDPDIPPILLFRSSFNYTDPTIPHFVTGELMAQTFPGYHRITTYPAGLYLRATDDMAAEDECKFILPFGIGANGHARKTDGKKFGQRKNGGNSHEDLYTPGHQPFEEPHWHSLVDVLESWRWMVERGDWRVDRNGVVGEIEMWREADSEGGWEGDVIPRKRGGVRRDLER